MTQEETAIVPLDYHEPEPMPVPLPAATKHSPNRRAKTKGPLRRYHTQQSRRNWLLMFESTGDETKATDSIGRTLDTIRKWKKDFPAFNAAAEKIEANWRDRNVAAINNLAGDSIDAIQRLVTSKELKASGEMGFKVLKGLGYLREQDIPNIPPGGTYTRDRERVTITDPNAPIEEESGN